MIIEPVKVVRVWCVFNLRILFDLGYRNILILEFIAKPIARFPGKGKSYLRCHTVSSAYGLIFRIILCQHLLADAVIQIKLSQESNEILISFIHETALNLRILHKISIRSPVGNLYTGSTQHIKYVRSTAAAHEIIHKIHGDLISGIAVPIGITIAESDKNLIKLIPCGRHVQTKIVKPGFIDQHGSAYLGPHCLIPGNAIYLSILCFRHGFCLRVIRKHFPNIRRLFFDQRGQILKQSVILYVVGIRSRSKKQIRDLSAGKHSALFLIPVSRYLLPFNFNIGLFLQV